MDLAADIPQGGSSCPLITGRIGNWKCWFLRREENRRAQRKTLGARTRTNNNLTLKEHGRFVPTVRFTLSRFVTRTFIKILHALAREQMSINAHDKSVKYKHNFFVCTCDLFKKSDLINA